MGKTELTKSALKEAITGEFTAITKYGRYSTQALKEGYRTGDISDHDAKEIVTCSEMGDIIAEYASR